jgi:hypothetical protein
VTIFEAWSQAKAGQKVRRSGWKDDPEKWLTKGDAGVGLNPHELAFNDWEIVEEEEAKKG